MKKFFAALPALILYAGSSPAQDVHAVAKADTAVILIGGHLHIDLSAEFPPGVRIEFPQIPDTIGKLEVVAKTPVDTTTNPGNNRVREHSVLTITCFDSGYYALPPFRFTYSIKQDTTKYIAETEPLLITVMTVPVDTTQAIKDIKKPLDAPFSWKEALPYILAGIAFILAAWGLYLFFKRKKRKINAPIPQRPSRPPHEIALEMLRELEKEKLWQHGHTKLYHSRLADTVRIYIRQVFEVNAMELTTEETLEQLKANALEAECRTRLEYLLQQADLVKFAKMSPLPDENDKSMKNAYFFIENTCAALRQDITANEGKEAGG